MPGCPWALGTVSSHRAAEQSLSLVPGLSMLVAMAVYTSERWSQSGNPQVQSFFAWSFYLGWVSVPLFLTTGNCCPGSLGGTAGGSEGAGWGQVLISLCHSRWPESGCPLPGPPAWL